MWNDFEKCTISNTTHYLGNIIYYPSENTGASYTEWILVDGQQRLTTILLLLVALRDVTSNTQLKDDIDNKYLKNKAKNKKYRIRLKTVISDNDDFQKIVGEDIDELKDSLLFDNYKFFKSQLLNNNTDHKGMFETIARSQIVEVRLNTNSNLELVQTIFEKINSTGQPLTSADLIRNYLLVSNSADEQKDLYSKYWIRIEGNLDIDNVPNFVSDYLIIKTTQQSISTKEVYEKFKDYCRESSLTNEDVLSDLLDYSKYYIYLIKGKEDKCLNKKISNNIKEINILKASDIMPLLLLLLYRMLDGNQKELERIVLLFSDFILRYRLVGDYSGGGALQGTIRQIINKLNNQTIDFKYEDILFELSNSSTKDGEFPTNERFLERLYTKAFTPDEAKVLLSRIESYDNKDIKIPYEKLTLEHIMPQELSQKWRDNLNLDEKSGYIFHSEHLWLLGNLTLLSGKWNSSLSNKLYDTKKNEYSENQFRITRNIVEKYDEWNKESIIDRTKNLAKKAVAATIGPKERTRPHKIETRKKTPSGQYFLSDNFTTEKTKIKSLLYKEDKIECKTWYDLFGKICQISYKENKERFEEIVEKNIISKTSKNQPLLSELNLEFDPLISKRSDVLNEPKKIRDTDYYHESNISSLSSKTHSLKLIREIGLDELDFIIEIH